MGSSATKSSQIMRRLSENYNQHKNDHF